MQILRSLIIFGLAVYLLCSCAKSEKYNLTRDDYQECVLANFIDKQTEMGRSAINYAFASCKSKRTELTQSAAEWTNAPASQVRRIDRAVLFDLYRAMREELEIPFPVYRIEIADGVPKPMPSLHPAISDRYWKR